MKVLSLITFVVFLICAVESNGEYQIGNKIRIAALSQPGFADLCTVKNESVLTGGKDYEILKLLGSIYNFKFHLVQPISLSFGNRNQNGSWSGLVGRVYRNEADIALPSIFMTLERYKDLEYTVPFYFSQIKFVVRAPGRKETWTAVFKPFSDKVWLCMALSLLIYGIALYFVVKKEFVSYGKRNSFSISVVYWLLLEGLMLQGTSSRILKSKRAGPRILLLIWWITALILSLFYGGAIISFMTYPSLHNVPRTFSELAVAVETGAYTCGTLKNSNSLSVFLGAKNIAGRKLGSHMKLNPSISNIHTSIQRVQEENFAFIAAERVYEVPMKLLGENRFSVSDDSFITFSLAFGLRKGFIHRKRINEKLKRLFESGIIDKMEKEAIGYSHPTIQRKRHEYNPLTLMDLLSPVLLLISGYVISTLCLVLEIFLGNERFSSK